MEKEDKGKNCEFIRKGSKIMRKYIRLPVNFHEEMVCLENKLFSGQNIETINKLMTLYKVGTLFS